MIRVHKVEVGHVYEVGKHGVDQIEIRDGHVVVHRNGAVMYFSQDDGLEVAAPKGEAKCTPKAMKVTMHRHGTEETYELGSDGVERIEVLVYRSGGRMQSETLYGPIREAEGIAKQWSAIPNDSTVRGATAFDESLYPEHAKLRRLLRCGNYLAAIKGINLDTFDEERSDMHERGHQFDMTPRQP